jgi:hypothetical protein
LRRRPAGPMARMAAVSPPRSPRLRSQPRSSRPEFQETCPAPARPAKTPGTRSHSTSPGIHGSFSIRDSRRLGCYRQALFVLAWYRDKTDIPRLGAGSGLPQATSYRYVAEGTKVVSAEAPGLEEALERAVREGTPYVILDGKIISADRCHVKTASRKGREIDLWYSGKKDLGGNIQGLFYPDGLPMRVSDVLPGNIHDLATARKNVSSCRAYGTRLRGI